jgi:hypothetical protein
MLLRGHGLRKYHWPDCDYGEQENDDYQTRFRES